MSKGYSVATALELTGRDFNGCIDAFNEITPEAQIVITDGISQDTLTISNVKKIPVLHYAIYKNTINNTNHDRQLLKNVIGKLLDEIHFI